MPKNPTVAILYDFDKTLCPKNMPEYSFIPSLGLRPEQFWELANQLSDEQKMDRILAFMYLMVRKSKDLHKNIHRETFVKMGEQVAFYEGVTDWFGRINAFGAQNGVEISHYIISSGLKEVIEGCKIAGEFDKIYACEFHYDENGVADWPKIAINYTSKTQFLFRINKGVFDISDDDSLNRYIADDQRQISFKNMIYIGDGLTDVPCMKLVKTNGGHSIAVYKLREKAQVQHLLEDGRVNFIAPADYREGRLLDELVKNIILKAAPAARLSQNAKKQRRELQDREETPDIPRTKG